MPRNFNPRTPVGCDPENAWQAHLESDFNPRTPVGCDPVAAAAAQPVGISIHAPQWGATSPATAPKPTSAHFNPRTPVGCDDGDIQINTSGKVISIHAPQWGATKSMIAQIAAAQISIHAPQWGATYQPTPSHQPAYISIHAPQWGATGILSPSVRRDKYFNPRTPVGCDHARCPDAPRI